MPSRSRQLRAESRTPDTNASRPGLLGPDEPEAVELRHEEGASAIVLVCDHAGRRIPGSLGSLGLTDTELESHIAWDIGVAGVATRLAQRLDAPLLLQTYSRLVIDCNRPPEAADSITTQTEWGQVEGNLRLTQEQISERRSAVFDPYHAALDGLARRRQRERRPLILVALHSFTPTYRGLVRPWHIGVMHGTDAVTAKALLAALRRDERLLVGDNEPYALEDGVDYTLPVHGAARGVAHVGIEIRQDLIVDESGQATWAGRLASLLRQLQGTAQPA
ncbi:MAG: N-formylglutamate amidohydrolase [Panacagrimonas sp.]